MSLDWVDLAGTFRSAGGWPNAKVIQVSLDHTVHNGWSMDHQGLPPDDLFVAADTDATVQALAAAMPKGAAKKPALAVVPAAKPARRKGDDEIAVEDLALNLREAVGDRAVT